MENPVLETKLHKDLDKYRIPYLFIRHLCYSNKYVHRKTTTLYILDYTFCSTRFLDGLTHIGQWGSEVYFI